MININPKKLMCFILIICSLPTILYVYTQMATSKEGLYEVDSISLEKKNEWKGYFICLCRETYMPPM